jgi:hypothetical protein
MPRAQPYQIVRRRAASALTLHDIIIESVVGELGLELPVLVDGLDRPVELLAQCFGEEALDRHIELLREDYGKTRINIVLGTVSARDATRRKDVLTILDVPRATSLLPSLSSI